ncbi:hypothetical protein CJ030_MR2G025686 [Morella rubra]|uniref:DUF4283 domain-containing protein n=1 Tax=Morella rubra TaxID=262757 RepID=A0A6A1WHQ5_9ROSI|nr:hypothetical protein CJ030_MR2G025686 [Morella rubra]
MDEIIETTKALSWNKLSGLLQPNKSRAQQNRKVSLVGRLLSKKVYPPYIIHPLIRTGWQFITDLRIEDAGPNRFLFTFPLTEDKERVRAQGPWNFKGYYMILREWNPNETIDELKLSMVEYWVQTWSAVALTDKMRGFPPVEKTASTSQEVKLQASGWTNPLSQRSIPGRLGTDPPQQVFFSRVEKLGAVVNSSQGQCIGVTVTPLLVPPLAIVVIPPFPSPHICQEKELAGTLPNLAFSIY